MVLLTILFHLGRWFRTEIFFGFRWQGAKLGFRLSHTRYFFNMNSFLERILLRCLFRFPAISYWPIFTKHIWRCLLRSYHKFAIYASFHLACSTWVRLRTVKIHLTLLSLQRTARVLLTLSISLCVSVYTNRDMKLLKCWWLSSCYLLIQLFGTFFMIKMTCSCTHIGKLKL